MLHDFVLGYLSADLSATPAVLDRLLADLDDSLYDRRPDPDRFTLREVAAHLADWEEVFQERLRLTLAGEGAIFAVLDPAQIAMEQDYTHAAPAECLTRFARRRAGTLVLISGLSPEQWDWAGTHARAGRVTVTEQVMLIAGHDGYHLHQIVQWMTE